VSAYGGHIELLTQWESVIVADSQASREISSKPATPKHFENSII
jgi:hypothetical protein